MHPFLSESHEDAHRSQPEMMFSPSVAAASLPGYFMSSFFPTEMAAGVAGADHLPADRALLASRNHREAEKRRRERIKSHLDRLRSLLSCDPKTDKASLLAKAVEHVRDLKQRMAEIADQAQLFPTETDEIIVLPGSLRAIEGGEGRQTTVFEASVCCDDRSDLLPELIETLRTLRMKTVRAEMATLGGRVRNVLVLARENQEDCDEGIGDCSGGDGGGGVIREALMNVVNRQVAGIDRLKRRRVVDADIYV